MNLEQVAPPDRCFAGASQRQVSLDVRNKLKK